MKWGVRKSRKSGGTSSGSSDSPKGPKPKPARIAKKAPKPTKKMSDQEMQKIIKRIQLENQYKQLTAPKPNATKKFLTDTLIAVGKQQAATYVNKAATAGIESVIKRAAVSAAKSAVKAAV